MNAGINEQAILLREKNTIIKSYKIDEPAKIQLLPSLEQQLWGVLQVEPLPFHQIVDKIYGGKMGADPDYQTYMNRLKQLISRLRKKSPGSILCRKGMYYLPEFDPDFTHYKLSSI